MGDVAQGPAASPRRLPRLILIRHGQAVHNVVPENKELLDPFLTPLGEAQAGSLQHTYPALFAALSPATTLLVSSPFRRTLQTTLLGFASLLPPSSPALPLVLLPQVQECGSQPCDSGAPLLETRQLFPNWIDWSEVEREPDWNTNRGFFDAEEGAQVARGLWVRRWLRERPEETIVVVSHHGFLRRIVKLPAKIGVTQWDNGEAREFRFCDPTGEDSEADVERCFVEGANII